MNTWVFKQGMVLAIVFAVFSSRFESCEGEDKRLVRVNASDITKSVQIISRLGQPLGSLLTIRGQWVEKLSNMDRGPFFRVDEVNGKKLPRPVELRFLHPFWNDGEGRGPKVGEDWTWKSEFEGDVPALEPMDGDKWEMTGAETGETTHYFTEEVWGSTGSLRPQSSPFMEGFYTTFRYLTIKIVGSKK